MCHGSLYCLLLYSACTDTNVTKKLPETGKEVFTRAPVICVQDGMQIISVGNILCGYKLLKYSLLTTNGFIYAIPAVVICYQYSRKSL
jgi:hypothetical protein